MVTQRTTWSHGFWTSLHRRVSYKNTLNSAHFTSNTSESCRILLRYSTINKRCITLQCVTLLVRLRDVLMRRRQRDNKSHKMSKANEDLVIFYLETSIKTHFLFILTHFYASFSRAELVLVLLWDLLSLQDHLRTVKPLLLIWKVESRVGQAGSSIKQRTIYKDIKRDFYWSFVLTVNKIYVWSKWQKTPEKHKRRRTKTFMHVL